ncbi:MAG: ATP-dependent Clp protease proteolytic subunit [Deltaproteobacteria bacterium]|nr:ATP-dependent Clp protease proteolytic subunit [Deltaproteobacteria bacterium]
MGSFNDILLEIQNCGQPDAFDQIRRKYLKKLSDKTGRNVIAYYSGWLQKPRIKGVEIEDVDKTAFMTALYQLDHSKGLDLILHTPGGRVDAAESIVKYLRKMFGINIVAYVPQIAMSAGTMIACATKMIVMGRHSNLGPIDPQFNGIPAFGVKDEFERAMKEVKSDPSRALIWRFVFEKYHPTFIGECENAIRWSKSIVSKWLETGMFLGDRNAKRKAKKIVDALQDRNRMLTHSRHIEADECEKIGLLINKLEDDQDLQEILLSIHHAYMVTFSSTAAIKITENHEGKAFVLQAHSVAAQGVP